MKAPTGEEQTGMLLSMLGPWCMPSAFPRHIRMVFHRLLFWPRTAIFHLTPPSARGPRGIPECASFRLFGMSHKCRISLHEHVAPLAEGWLALSQRQRQWMSIRPVLLGRSMFVRTETQGIFQRALRCLSKRVLFSRCKGTQTVNSKQAYAARDRRLGGGALGGAGVKSLRCARECRIPFNEHFAPFP